MKLSNNYWGRLKIKSPFAMKNILQTLFILCCCLTFEEALSQNIDDTSFAGSWKMISKGETSDILFSRCEILEKNQHGFQLILDGKSLRIKPNEKNEWAELPGVWWSLNMGWFNMQYYDPTIHQMVIEGFEYVSSDNKNLIKLVRYEEFQRTEDSGFQGFWKEVSSNNPNEVIYVRSDGLGNNVSSMYITDKNVVRRVLTKPGKHKFVDVNGTWWSSTEGYFDIQYYHPKRKLIIIEGFEVVKSGDMTKIKRTRYDEMRNK